MRCHRATDDNRRQITVRARTAVKEFVNIHTVHLPPPNKKTTWTLLPDQSACDICLFSSNHSHEHNQPLSHRPPPKTPPPRTKTDCLIQCRRRCRCLCRPRGCQHAIAPQRQRQQRPHPQHPRQRQQPQRADRIRMRSGIDADRIASVNWSPAGPDQPTANTATTTTTCTTIDRRSAIEWRMGICLDTGERNLYLLNSRQTKTTQIQVFCFVVSACVRVCKKMPVRVEWAPVRGIDFNATCLCRRAFNVVYCLVSLATLGHYEHKQKNV